MKIKITESQKEVLSKMILEYYKKSNPFSEFIRKQLQKLYEPLGKWGKAPNPNDNCETNTGVINAFPHSENDVWSILNRFDTNSKVKNEMHNIFLESNPTDKSEQSFMSWINDNSNDLFGEDGQYTQRLISLNVETINKGNQNEEFAVNILKERFPQSEIKRYCSGDIRDTKKGIDITVSTMGKSFNIQVKPFMSIGSFVTDDGDTFFEIKSYFEPNKYSERNVSIFMFVDIEKNEFILFLNKKDKINQMRNNATRFSEPPLYTNIKFVTKEKRKSKNADLTSKIFGQDEEMIKNLEFRKDQIMKQIEKRKKPSI
jgi:hypothetical protein